MNHVLFVSLGCDKNLVDSEKMIGLLADAGYEIVDDESQAEIAIINTCCFIHDAREESIEAILELASYKEKGKLKALVICGCLGQRYEDEIKKELPEVDAVVGTAGYDDIVTVIDALVSKEPDTDSCIFHCPDISRLPASLPNVRRVGTGGFSASLKIAEGCNKMCSYCVIPSVRGSYRSFPMEDLVAEAKSLAGQGVKELVLVAQETTVYGLDLYGYKALPDLLRKLCRIEGFDWIRILYCYPEEIDDDLIEVMAEEPKICHYLDLPIQHSEDEILKKMGRRTSRKEIMDLIVRLRSRIPDIVLRTTLITGFPGETEELHERMIAFIEEMKFERLGVFAYSAEEGTPAASMKDQVAEEVKDRRRDELMLAQQEVSAGFQAGCIGKRMQVMIEGYLYEEDIYIGRTYMDAPKVDGNVFVTADEELMSGDLVSVLITGASEYDLMGDVIYADEFTE